MIGQTPGIRRRQVGANSTLLPVRRAAVREAGSSVLLTQALTVAGIIPTAAEITTALQAAYTTATTTPRQGDIINLTVSGVCKLRTTVTTTGTASGLFVVAFTVGSTTYYGNQVQTGLY